MPRLLVRSFILPCTICDSLHVKRMNFAQLLDPGSATSFKISKKNQRKTGRSLLGLFLKRSSSEGSFREVQTDLFDLDVNLFIRQLFHPVVTIC